MWFGLGWLFEKSNRTVHKVIFQKYLGAAVGYGIPPMGTYVPVWLLFTTVVGVVFMAWKGRT